MSKLKDRKAISPVIATVILVAVAITVAVAVAYWMGGIAGQYTKFEKVEIQSAVCTWDDTNFDWVIELTLKNTGTASANLISVFINDRPVDVYGHTSGSAGEGKAETDMKATGLLIESGASGTVTVYIDGVGDLVSDSHWQSVTPGTTVNIKMHSAGGMDYIKLVELV